MTGKQIPSDIPPTALPEPLGWRGDLGDEIAHQLRVGPRGGESRDEISRLKDYIIRSPRRRVL
jgi:hypothetical protein